MKCEVCHEDNLDDDIEICDDCFDEMVKQEIEDGKDREFQEKLVLGYH